jgi:hypothetical protein
MSSDHVADGDTVALRNGQRVRLVQIDTPEVYVGTGCYGRQAQRAVSPARRSRPVLLRGAAWTVCEAARPARSCRSREEARPLAGLSAHSLAMTEPSRSEAAERLVCAECGQVPDADENAADEWRAYSDGVGELHVFCPDCAEREFDQSWVGAGRRSTRPTSTRLPRRFRPRVRRGDYRLVRD